MHLATNTHVQEELIEYRSVCRKTDEVLVWYDNAIARGDCPPPLESLLPADDNQRYRTEPRAHARVWNNIDQSTFDEILVLATDPQRNHDLHRTHLRCIADAVCAKTQLKLVRDVVHLGIGKKELKARLDELPDWERVSRRRDPGQPCKMIRRVDGRLDELAESWVDILDPSFPEAVRRIKPEDTEKYVELKKQVVAKYLSVCRQGQAALVVLLGLDDAPDSF